MTSTLPESIAAHRLPPDAAFSYPSEKLIHTQQRIQPQCAGWESNPHAEATVLQTAVPPREPPTHTKFTHLNCQENQRNTFCTSCQVPREGFEPSIFWMSTRCLCPLDDPGVLSYKLKNSSNLSSRKSQSNRMCYRYYPVRPLPDMGTGAY